MSHRWSHCHVHGRYQSDGPDARHDGACPGCAAAAEEHSDVEEAHAELLEALAQQMSEDAERARAGDGDFRCVRCGYRTLLYRTMGCYKCGHDVPAGFWDDVDARKRAQEEKENREKKEREQREKDLWESVRREAAHSPRVREPFRVSVDWTAVRSWLFGGWIVLLVLGLIASIAEGELVGFLIILGVLWFLFSG